MRQLLRTIRHPLKAYKQYVAQEKKIVHNKGIEGDKTFYVIRCDLPECGLFAIFMYVLDHVAYAVDKGYVPVLDIEQYKCLYKEDIPVNGVSNPWNYYFKEIMPYDSNKLVKCKNVIYSAIKFPHYKAIYYYREKEKNVLPGKEQLQELKHLVDIYFPFTDDLNEKLKKDSMVLNRFDRLLGIHVRGTDMYTEGKQHPVPTGDTKDFSIIDSLLQKHNLDGIFLCTDTNSTVELFKEHYGDKVITTDAVRQIDDSKGGIHKDGSLGGGREFHKYQLGLEVITDMYLLSQCNVLLCGPSNVPFTALVYNGGAYDQVIYCA